MSLTARTTSQSSKATLPSLALMVPEERLDRPGAPKESVILLGPQCPSWKAVLGFLEEKAEESGVGGVERGQAEPPLAVLLFTFDLTLYPALKEHSAPKGKEKGAIGRRGADPPLFVGVRGVEDRKVALLAPVMDGAVLQALNGREGKGREEKEGEAKSDQEAASGNPAAAGLKGKPDEASASSSLTPLSDQLPRPTKPRVTPEPPRSSAEETGRPWTADPPTATAGMDVRPQPLGVLRRQAEELDPIKPRPQTLTALTDLCQSPLERVGGKEEVERLARLVASRRDRNRPGDIEYGLAELETQVGVRGPPAGSHWYLPKTTAGHRARLAGQGPTLW